MLFYHDYLVGYCGFTILLSIIRVGNSQFTVKPQNTVVLKGRTAVLECELQGEGILLWYSYVNNATGTKISQGMNMLDEFKNDFAIVRHGGKFNLKLTAATLLNGGKYSCKNSLKPNDPVYAIIVVLESEPKITKSVPDNLLLERQRITYTCQVKYATYSNILMPKLVWKGSRQGDIAHTSENEKNIANISIQITGEVANNGEVYSCVTSFEESNWPSTTKYAKNNPTYRHIANTTALIVHYSPRNTAIRYLNNTVIKRNANVTIEENIMCTSESNPEVFLYEWITTRDNSVVGTGSILPLKKEWIGLIEIRCNATNNIRLNMPKTDFVEIYLNLSAGESGNGDPKGMSQREIAVIAGSTGGGAVFVIILIIVVVIICRCCKKRARKPQDQKNDNNGNEDMQIATNQRNETVQTFVTPNKDKRAIFRQISEHTEYKDGRKQHIRKNEAELTGFDKEEFPSRETMLNPRRMMNNRPHLQLQQVEEEF